MIISRFSAAIVLMLLASGCAKNMPPANTDLGRIARISDVQETERALIAYTQRRIANREGLAASFKGAGFSHSVDHSCDIYRWDGRNWGTGFAKSMVVRICGGRVEANAGYLAL